MKILIFSTLAIFCFLFSLNFSSAAPIPEEKKYDLEGTIADIKWYPAKFIKGIPGMSGSVGKDRIVPSHYIIKLIDYKGISHDDARRISRYINWNYPKNQDKSETTFILLKINCNDPNYLQRGLKIRVIGYKIRGDEGGTNTQYEKIEIINANNN